MRRSNRERIIAGALEIIGEEGVDALTFEALAERVGLTRGGVVYHFRTREALLAGIAEDLLARWRDEAHINDEIDKLRHSATAALAERKDVIIV